MLRTLTSPAERAPANRIAAVLANVGSSFPRPIPRIAKVAGNALRLAALLPVTASLAFGVANATITAQVPQLTEVGPVNPVEGFPHYYADANGLRLKLCQDPGVCFFVLPNPTAPLHFPTAVGDPAENYPDEQFYWACNGELTGPSARMIYISALEAAFVNGIVEIGQQMVFTRLRMRLTGLVDGASYTITHPYGVETLTAGVDGPLPGTINITDDVGAGAAGVFNLALNGNVGPFLVPLGFLNGGPGSFIADGATATQVQGSPFGTNFLRIQGPNAGLLFPANAIDANTAQLNEFVLQGQIATTLGVGIRTAYVSRQGAETAVNVWAFAASGAQLQASSGATSVGMVERGTSGVFFGRVVLGAGAVVGSVTVTNLTDFPPTAIAMAPVPDLVTVPSAVFTVGGDLVVTATSSDQVGNPALTAIVDGAAPRVLTATGAGTAAAGLGLLPGDAPPSAVEVRSAAGGSMVVPVAVVVAPPVVVPVVANAGADQSVAAGAAVTLSGLASTGPIVSYAWTHDAGALVTLAGAATATPSFVAPRQATALDVTLTLTVRDVAGNASTDTVVVHVAADAPQVDVLTINDARYIVQRNSWRVAGTSSLRQGQSVTVYVGAVGDTSRPIGSATVNGVGAWLLQTAQGSGPAPLASDTQLWARSALGGQLGVAFRRN